MPKIRCPDGVVRDYTEYEDIIKPRWKEQMRKERTPEKLAEEHWSYIESLLEQHGESDDVVDKIGFHYKTAFVHGYKHGKEEI